MCISQTGCLGQPFIEVSSFQSVLIREVHCTCKTVPESHSVLDSEWGGCSVCISSSSSINEGVNVTENVVLLAGRMQ